MPEPIINFNQFSNMVNTKLKSINMSQDKQSYVQSQLQSIFTQGDTNKDNQLSKSELNSVLGMLNQVVSLAQETELGNQKIEQKQQIKNPHFQGLEEYKFEQHGAKEGVGVITVNGEKMLISTDGKEYSLTRFEMKDGEITNVHDMPNYSSLDELKKALTDKNNNFGMYSGLEDINDVFIP